MKKNRFKNKKRVVVKIGSSSLTHPKTGNLDFIKLERLVRELCDLRNQDIDVCLVSSGQASLMMTYQKLFSEYHQTCGQVLMTKKTMIDNVSRKNAENTFEELFRLGVIPIVNENDTVSTYEIQFGDNDTLSAIVASLIGADLLVLLSDIDGLFTDDPHTNPNAELIETVEKLDEKYLNMAKDTTGSDVGTGGMATKLNAARIASYSGADMIIANAKDVGVLHKIFEDDFIGTVFLSNKDEDFYIPDFIEENMG